MEKSTSEKIRLGLFVILGLFLFVIAIYFIGKKQKMFGKTSHLISIFDNVNGLQLGNNVRYSGINAGTVGGIEMLNDSVIKVDMILDNTIFGYIKKDAIATIGSDGLVGNMIINITPGKGIFSIVTPYDTIKSLKRIRADDMLNTLGITNKNAAKLTSDLLKITKEITEGKGTIGLLIKDSTMANDLKETIKYIKETGNGTSKIVLTLNKLIQSLDKKDNVIGFVKDTSVANNMKKIVRNLEKSSNQINLVLNHLDATILNVKEGNGALNYLSNDPKLVLKIDSTMTNINEASFRLNENLEALKHNFLFRSYFKKMEKEKLKTSKK